MQEETFLSLSLSSTSAAGGQIRLHNQSTYIGFGTLFSFSSILIRSIRSLSRAQSQEIADEDTLFFFAMGPSDPTFASILLRERFTAVGHKVILR